MVLRKDPLVLLDGAHNVHGITNVDTIFEGFYRKDLFFGIKREGCTAYD